MKRIEFEISDVEYAILAEVAHQRGIMVSALMQGQGRRLAREWARPLSRQIADLWEEDLTVADIARELGLTNLRVQNELRRLGLPAKPGRRMDAPTPSPRSGRRTA